MKTDSKLKDRSRRCGKRQSIGRARQGKTKAADVTLNPSPTSSSSSTPCSTSSTTTWSSTTNQSSIGPAFIPECEVYWEGGPDQKAMVNGCRKNPGHTKFLSVEDLALEKLPSQWRTQYHLDTIRNHWDLTVKVSVTSTSQNRPDKWPRSNHPYPYSYLKGSDRAERVGTGFIDKWSAEMKYGRCPCHLCRESVMIEEIDFMEVKVFTATHVIYDDVEATNVKVECFYDYNDKTGVKLLYGVGIDKTGDLERCRKDKCYLKCVTHDEELMRKLKDVMERREPFYFWGLSFIVSHPHGGRKMLSIGNVSYHTMRDKIRFPAGVPHSLIRLFEVAYRNSKAFTCRIPVSSNPSTDFLPSCDVTPHNDSPSPQNDEEYNTKLSEDDRKMISGLIPGVDCQVPATTTFTLPQDAKYVHRHRKDGIHMWITFPPGTIFTVPDGRLLPPLTEFKALVTNYQDFPKAYRCLNYDIPTCPGSSGASVMVGRNESNPWGTWFDLPHSGVSLEDSTNQSSWEDGW